MIRTSLLNNDMIYEVEILVYVIFYMFQICKSKILFFSILDFFIDLLRLFVQEMQLISLCVFTNKTLSQTSIKSVVAMMCSTIFNCLHFL